MLTGDRIEAKAAFARAQFEAALPARPAELAWSQAGAERPDADTEEGASVLLRCSALDPSPDVVGRAFSGAAVEMALAGYPGFHLTAPPGNGSPFGVYTAAYVPPGRGAARRRPARRHARRRPPPRDPPPNPRVAALARRGRRRPCADRRLADPAGAARRGGAGAQRRQGRDGERRALGPHGRPAAAWLAATLTPRQVRELLPEAAGLPVTVHALPNLRAVNVVIDGLLGAGRRRQHPLRPAGQGGRRVAARSRLLDVPEDCCEPDPWTTPERLALRETARGVRPPVVLPHLDEWEDAGEVPRALHRAAADAGLLGIGFPEEVGGQGGDLIDVVTSAEAMIEAGASCGLLAALFTARHRAAAHRRGRERRPDRPLRAPDAGRRADRLARGHRARRRLRRRRAAHPRGPRRRRLRRQRRQDLHHQRHPRRLRHHRRAHRRRPAPAGSACWSSSGARPGSPSTGGWPRWAGSARTPPSSSYVGVRVPAANLVGAEGGGFGQIMAQFVTERLALAVHAYAVAARALALTRPGPRTGRRSAPRWPPAGRRPPAGRDAPAGRAGPHVHPRRRRPARRRGGRRAEACLAKNAAVAAGEWVVDQAVQLHGGAGYLRGSEVERHYRDVRILGIGGGATEVLADLAGRCWGTSPSERASR